MSATENEEVQETSPAPQAAPASAEGTMAAPLWGPYTAAVAVVLVVLVAVAFSPCLGNDFVTWDDHKNFLENPFYRGLGWSQIGWAWNSFQFGVYQPLAWMILEAQYVVFGLQPWGYHLTSLVFYAINTVVLFALTLTLLRRCRPERPRAGPGALALGAGLAVGLFAVHPLRAEVVAWASCQPYLPCALFCMLAVLAYLRAFEEGPSPRWDWLMGSFYLFVAALLSKAVAVSLPTVLLILDVYPLRRLGGGPGRWFGPEARPVWREKVPFFGLSAIFMGLALFGRRQEQHLVSFQQSGPAARIAQACYGIWFYLVKTVLPMNITAYYAVPERVGLSEPLFLSSVVATLGVSVGLFLLRRRWPALLAAWVSYVAILAPNLGIIQIGGQIAADRYSYIAMLGLVVLLAAGLCRVAQASRRLWLAAMGLSAAGLAVLLGLIVLTRGQCRTWRTSEVLWTHVLTHGENRSFLAHNNLGVVLYDQGRIEEARAEVAEALRLNPRYPDAHTSMGVVLSRQGRFEEALAHYHEAIRINPNVADAHTNMGLLLFQQGRVEEAMAQYAEALRLNPGDADAHNHLGSALLGQGRLEEAAAQYAEAVRLKPGLADAHSNLGLVLFRQGRLEEAAARFAEALRLNPSHVGACINLGLVLLDQGRIAEATALFAEAVRLNPNDAEAHNSLGVALVKQGRLEEARAQFAEAVRLDPNHAQARQNLGAVLRHQGRSE